MLDARWLRTLAAVVEHRSFGAAAAELGYTQSAVSQQISELERAVGLPLLERRPVRPTAAGEVALAAAHQTGAVLDAAATQLRALRDGTAGTVRIGAFRSAAEAIVAPALGTFARRHPDVRVAIAQLETAAAHDALIAGAIDLAVTFDDAPVGPPVPAPITRRRLLTDDVLVALPADHPLAAQPRVALLDLAGERWIDAPDAGVNPTLAVTRARARHGLRRRRLRGRARARGGRARRGDDRGPGRAPAAARRRHPTGCGRRTRPRGLPRAVGRPRRSTRGHSAGSAPGRGDERVVGRLTAAELATAHRSSAARRPTRARRHARPARRRRRRQRARRRSAAPPRARRG